MTLTKKSEGIYTDDSGFDIRNINLIF